MAGFLAASAVVALHVADDSFLPRAVFLLYGEDGQPEEIDLNPIYHDASGEPAEIWEVPDSGHIAGLDAQPKEYERRVIGFLDRVLLGEG